MQQVLQSLRSFWADETGATAIEYGLMIALIAAVIVFSVTSIGKQLSAGFDKVLACLKGDATLCK